MPLMVEKSIWSGISHAIYRYVKTNNRYMKNYDKNTTSSYLIHLDANNLFGWAMSPKLPLNDFKWVKKLSKFDESFIKSYDENSDQGYFPEVDVVHIRALKQALNHGLILKKLQRVIQFNQEAWFKPYIDMNTKLRTEAKHDFEKDFFKLMNNAVFGKAMENVRKYRDIKLLTTDKRRNRLASEPNYHTTKYFPEN